MNYKQASTWPFSKFVGTSCRNGDLERKGACEANKTSIDIVWIRLGLSVTRPISQEIHFENGLISQLWHSAFYVIQESDLANHTTTKHISHTELYQECERTYGHRHLDILEPFYQAIIRKKWWHKKYKYVVAMKTDMQKTRKHEM